VKFIPKAEETLAICLGPFAGERKNSSSKCMHLSGQAPRRDDGNPYQK
jgi:hypothetical protein